MPKTIKKVNKLRRTAHTTPPSPTFFARSSSRAQSKSTPSLHCAAQDAETPNKKINRIFRIQQTVGLVAKPNQARNVNIQPTQRDPRLKIAPLQITDISQKNITELALLNMTPPTEKFNALGILLVYGFETARDLSPEAGINKFTLNQINDALGIDYGTINHTLMAAMKQGIAVDKAKIDVFSTLTKITPLISEKLLVSYAHFLRDHYDYLSISACLARKAQKYPESFSKYTFIKNNHHLEKLSDNEVEGLATVFSAFLSGGDQQGYIQKEAFFCNQDKTQALACLDTAFDNLIFRRISKLDLMWSAHYALPLNFYRTFIPEEAKNKARIEAYEPITFSEYRLIARHRSWFTQIKEIDCSLTPHQTRTMALRT